MSEMWAKRLVYSCAACLLLGLAIPARAQLGQANGGIRGVITDASGGAIHNAAIKARNLDTGFERDAASNERGEYEVPLLPIGIYKVDIFATGFAPFEQSGVRVELDKASALDVRLEVGATQQTVTVAADASMLNTLTYDVSG